MSFSPSKHTTSNKSYGVQGIPDSARTYFYDDVTHYKYRPFVNTAEVLAYFDTPAKRLGHFSIIINSGGTLTDGEIVGGTNSEYWFKNGLEDSDLIIKFGDGVMASFELLTGAPGDNVALASVLAAKVDKTTTVNGHALSSNVVVTKADVGLGNADDTSDANKPVSTAQAAAIATVQTDINTHEARTDNPHSVTKAQVGLSQADNTSDADKPVSTAQATAIAAVESDIAAHEARTDNPHSVTKAQVGLSNADNTSDANKPVSTATQAELDLKLSILNAASTYQALSQKNQISGYAGLDGSGLIPSSLLPSYVDDIIEVADYASLPGTGVSGIIYITLDTNEVYRWSGSAYVEIVASPGSTDEVAEGVVNLYYTDARVQALGDTLYSPILSGTGLVKSTGGVISYITDNSTNWNTAYTYSQVGHLPLAGGTLSGNLNLNAGLSYQIGGATVVRAQTSIFNYYLGTGGNLTATGANNIAIGKGPGVAFTSGSNNITIGNDAGKLINSGFNHVAIGQEALAGMTTGAYGIAIGYRALFNATNGQNIAIGVEALKNLTSGGSNVAIGPSAMSLCHATSTSHNVGVGVSALTQIKGEGNVGIGTLTGDALTTDNYNTLIGWKAGLTISNPSSNNTIIGAQVDPGGNVSNNIILGIGSGAIKARYDGTSWTFTGAVASSGSVTGTSIIKSGGTSSQFLKADGSVDSSTYLTSSTGVSSITGTANQITASAATGAVTLSLPATITGLTSVTSTGFTGALTGNASTATNVAGTGITGTTLASNVVTSSLTSVGTLINVTVTNDATIGGNVNATGTVFGAQLAYGGGWNGSNAMASRGDLYDKIQTLSPIASPTFTGTVTIPSGSILNTPASMVGTNITGTASGLNIGGNAATATLAANSTLWGGAAYAGPYLPLTAGSGSPLSGILYSSKTQEFFNNTGATTTYKYGVISNTGGSFQYGIEGSAGGGLFVGSTAYASQLGSNTNTGLDVSTNNTVRYAISASGNHDFKSGTATFGGAFTGTTASFTGNANGVTLAAATGTTNTQYKVSNTSGDNYLGVAASDGSSVFTGTAAYSAYIGTAQARSFHIATGGTVGYTMDASRNNTWTGSMTNTIATATIASDATANVTLLDSTSQAVGTGGSISLGGKYTNAGAYVNNAITIKAYKESATDGHYGFGISFGNRTHGSGNPTEKMYLSSAGALTVTGTGTFGNNVLASNADALTYFQIINSSAGGKIWSLIGAGASNPHSFAAGVFYLRNSTDNSTGFSVYPSGDIYAESGLMRIGRSTMSSNGSSYLQMANSNSVTNWQISTNNSIAGALEFTPSTVGGGATFTTPIAYMTSTSVAFNALITSNVTVNAILAATAASTSPKYINIANNSGSLVAGTEGSAGGTIIIGNPAYYGGISAGAGLGISANGGANVHLSMTSAGVTSLNNQFSATAVSSAVSYKSIGRSGSNDSQLNFYANDGTTSYGYLYAASSGVQLGASGARTVILETNGTTALTIASNQQSTFTRSVAAGSYNDIVTLLNPTTASDVRVGLVMDVNAAQTAGVRLVSFNNGSGGGDFSIQTKTSGSYRTDFYVSAVAGTITMGSGDEVGTPVPQRFKTITDVSNTTDHNLLNLFRANQTAANSASIQNTEMYTKTSHSSGTVASVYGLISNVEHNGAGVITNVYAITAGGVIKGTVGTVSNYYGVISGGMTNGASASGTVTNSYLFYGSVYTSTGVTSTNKWGVYIADTVAGNFFGGSVTATAFLESSDITKKDVVSRAYSQDGFDMISFKWKPEFKKDDRIHYGYSAQEVQKVLPDQVHQESTGLSVNYIDVLVYKVAKLEARIKELENG